jgi:3-oxoacyl-[acyl-carrier-protein] synthase-1
LATKKGVKYTKLEKACIISIAEALKGTNINPAEDNVLFVLSTTKGNVFLLDENEKNGYAQEQLYLWHSANLIAKFFGSICSPFVVSNACISGASALIAAQRQLQSRRCEHVIVIGVDMLSKFIITGFQSFKALSQEVCKPFDANRTGLNIGEAVATMILTERNACDCENGDIELTVGAMRNDANHISGPSRLGDGSYLALRHVLAGVAPDEIAFVCAHGTATPYNDEMESIALTRAGLKDVPVYSLKGYFGHTLGAAGVLESVISTHALKEGTILKTYGCDTPGVSYPLDVVMVNRETTKRRCIKMLSGFGGCNAAILFTKFF